MRTSFTPSPWHHITNCFEVNFSDAVPMPQFPKFVRIATNTSARGVSHLSTFSEVFSKCFFLVLPIGSVEKMKWRKFVAAASVCILSAATDKVDAGRLAASQSHVLQADPLVLPQVTAAASGPSESRSDENVSKCVATEKLRADVLSKFGSSQNSSYPEDLLTQTSAKDDFASRFLKAVKHADTFQAEGGSEGQVMSHMSDALTALKDQATTNILQSIARKAKNGTVITIGAKIPVVFSLQSMAKRMFVVEADERKCKSISSIRETLCVPEKTFQVLCVATPDDKSSIPVGGKSLHTSKRVQQHFEAAKERIAGSMGSILTADLVIVNSDFPVAAAYLLFEFVDQSSLVLVRARLTPEAKQALSDYYKIVTVISPNEGNDEDKESVIRVLLRPLFSKGPEENQWKLHTAEKWRSVDDFSPLVMLTILKHDFKRTYANAIADQKAQDSIASKFKLIKKFVHAASEEDRVGIDNFLRDLRDAVETASDFESAEKILSDEVTRVTSEVNKRGTALKPFLEPFQKRISSMSDAKDKEAASRLMIIFLLAAEDLLIDESKKELLFEAIEDSEKRAVNGDDKALMTGMEQLNIDVERIKADTQPKAIEERVDSEKEMEKQFEKASNTSES